MSMMINNIAWKKKFSLEKKNNNKRGSHTTFTIYHPRNLRRCIKGHELIFMSMSTFVTYLVQANWWSYKMWAPYLWRLERWRLIWMWYYSFQTHSYYTTIVILRAPYFDWEFMLVGWPKIRKNITYDSR